jgi:hypothetical protein
MNSIEFSGGSQGKGRHGYFRLYSAVTTHIPSDPDGQVLHLDLYRDVTNIPNLQKAREVYQTLLDAFRLRFGEAQRQIGNAEYVKILRELRFNPKARLNPDQAVRVFHHMQGTLPARE